MVLIVFRIGGNMSHLALLARRSRNSTVPFETAVPWIPYWKAERNYIVAEHLISVAETSLRKSQLLQISKR